MKIEFNDKPIKEKIIEWINGKKINDDELLSILQSVVVDVCGDYLNATSIPVKLKEVPGNIAVFDNNDICIYINPKYKDDKIILLAAVIHELEHYYQLVYVSNYDTPKANRWKLELINYIGDNNPLENALQEIELDAEAFAEVVLSCEYGISYINPNPNLQLVIDEYIKSGKLMEE